MTKNPISPEYAGMPMSGNTGKRTYPQEKLLRRRGDIKPGYDAFKELVETQHKNVLIKGAIGRALHYAVNQLPSIDPIENKIRLLALGRKNFLFAGSHKGAVY